jgi:threonine/homoserine/homoserine lactone efflux protein
MTINYALLLAYLTSIVLLIATPGPVVALVLGNAARKGFRQGLMTALGTNFASLVLIGLATLIVSGLVFIDARLLAWISAAGCVFVGWVAVRSLYGEFRNARTDDTPPSDIAQTSTRHTSSIAHGFLVGISNPKDILFFVAFFPQFIGITSSSRTSLVILAMLWIAFDALILTGYAALANSSPLQRNKRAMAVVSALFLLIVAAVGLFYAIVEAIS